MTERLKKAYSTETYQMLSQETERVILSALDIALNEKRNVTNFIKADHLYEIWKESNPSFPKMITDIVEHSVLIHHPKYIGHQVCMPLPIGSTMSHFGSHINNGMAVYEMGMAASVIDRLMIEKINPYFGYGDKSSGIFTSGGTVANITALLCARANFDPTIWKEGQKEKIGFMVSDQAHYCIDRAVRIMGLGDDGIVLIPSDQDYKADTNLLEQTYQIAIDKGIRVMGIIGSAPSTATGMYDDLRSFGNFAKKYNLWYHIDAAHGGPAVFSEKYAHLMDGCEMADSITVDAHKMMMMPALTTMLLFKNHEDSYKTFAQEASYLFGHEDWDWSNYGKRTMECTKIMLGMRLYAAWQEYGVEIFKDNVEQCFDQTKEFTELLLNDQNFEVPVNPDSNIICFRLKDATDSEIEKIRELILESGQYYILKTKLRGKLYFRCTLMNPFTTIDHLRQLLNELKLLFAGIR